MIFGVDHRITVATIVTINIILCLLMSFLVLPFLQTKFEIATTQDEYDDLALSLSQNKGFRSYHGEESVIRGPGYPFFLSIIYRVFGYSFTPVKIIQCLLSGAIVFLTYVLGMMVRDRKTGIVASALMALHPLLIWYTPRIMVETLFTFFCLLIFIFMIKLFKTRTATDALLVGLFVSCTAFIKSIALTFPAVILLIMIFWKIPWKKAAYITVVILLTMLVLILPWSLRNYNVSNKIIPVHASLALPLLQGHLYTYYFFHSPLSSRMAMKNTEMWMREITSAELGKSIGYHPQSLKEELDLEQAVKSHFVRKYAADPVGYIGSSAIRFLLFWYYSSSPMFSVLLLLLNILIILMAIAGLRKSDNNKFNWFVLIWTGFYVIFHSLIIASARFTLQLQPLWLILVAIYLIDFHQRRTKKSPPDSAEPATTP